MNNVEKEFEDLHRQKADIEATIAKMEREIRKTLTEKVVMLLKGGLLEANPQSINVAITKELKDERPMVEFTVRMEIRDLDKLAMASIALLASRIPNNVFTTWEAGIGGQVREVFKGATNDG